MTARVVTLAATHQNVQELLPWFVMGTLDDDDRQLVERHLENCPGCRHEIEWHGQMRDANLAQPLPRDAGRAFAALRARLPGALREQPRTSLISAAVEWWRAQQSGVRWALALQPLAIAALGIALLLGAARTVDPAPQIYHALSSPAAASSGRLVVVFSPQATQAEMRRVLLSSGTRIVDGPTAADAYVLAVAPERAEQALKQMRQERSVLLIQSLEAGATH